MTIRSDSTRRRIPSPERRRPRAMVARQGLVLLDTHLDQGAAALLDRVEIETSDLLDSSGRLVYPAGDSGFRIVSGTSAANFDIGAGHGYLDGWLLENPAIAKLATQPHPRAGDTVTAPAIVAIRALVRHIDPVEDPALADVALGDAQASGRALNDWQVFPLSIGGGAAISCASAADRTEWANLIKPSTGTMRVIKQASGPSSDPCSLTPGGGYTRLENLLYRIEVHGGVQKTGFPQADGPRFELNGLKVKLQRRNASLMARIVQINGNEMLVEPAALDPRNWFAPGAFAEIVNVHDDVDPRAAAAAERLFRVSSATDDRVTLEQPVPTAIASTGVAANGSWFLRLWDAFPGGTGFATIAATGATSQVIDIGDGLSIEFQGGAPAIFRPGDYWTFAARADGSVAWPEASPGNPAPMLPHGPEIRYAVLATMSPGATPAALIDDCRIPFASLTDKLLFYRGGDGQSVCEPAPAPAPAVPPPFVPLPQKLRVAVMRGQTPVAGAFVRWSPPPGAVASRVANQACTAAVPVVTVTDANGLAEVAWEIDRTRQNDVHRVQAILATSPTTNLANAIVFGATFETAQQTGYAPGACSHLLGIHNVQAALDTLCAKIEVRPPVLTLTEISLHPAAGAAQVDLIEREMILNGCDVAFDSFLDGIHFVFDGGVPDIAIAPYDPVVEVALDLPYPTTDADRLYWAKAAATTNAAGVVNTLTGPFGFQKMRLDGTTRLARTSGQNHLPAALAGPTLKKPGLFWQPSGQARRFLATAPQHLFGQKLDSSFTQALAAAHWNTQPQPVQRILCRLSVRGPMVWKAGTAQRAYLNAEHLGIVGPITGRELSLHDRDPQSAAGLDIFFYLVPRGFKSDIAFPRTPGVVEDLDELKIAHVGDIGDIHIIDGAAAT